MLNELLIWGPRAIAYGLLCFVAGAWAMDTAYRGRVPRYVYWLVAVAISYLALTFTPWGWWYLLAMLIYVTMHAFYWLSLPFSARVRMRLLGLVRRRV